ADRAGRVLADRPDVAAVGEHNRLATGATKDVRRRAPGLFYTGRAAVDLDQERRGDGEPEGAEALERRDGLRVGKLDPGDVDAEAVRVGGGVRGGGGVAEAEAALLASGRQAGQRERQLGRDRERPLGADEEPEEMVAGGALPAPVTEPEDLAGAGDDRRR